jgi:hypothetical protein
MPGYYMFDANPLVSARQPRRLTPPVFYYPGGFRLVAGYARDNPVYRARP